MVHLSNEDVYLFKHEGADNKSSDSEDPANEPNDPRKLFFSTVNEIEECAQQPNEHNAPLDEEPVMLEDGFFIELLQDRVVCVEDELAVLQASLSAIKMENSALRRGLGELLVEKDNDDSERARLDQDNKHTYHHLQLLQSRVYELELKAEEFRKLRDGIPNNVKEGISPSDLLKIKALIATLSALVVGVFALLGITTLL